MRDNEDLPYWNEKWAARQDAVPNDFARRCAEHAHAHQLKDILDLGCGNGRDSAFFTSEGLNVTAVDFSGEGLKALAETMPDIKCVQSDIRDITFPPQSFDIVYAHLTLHYFFDDELTVILQNINNILKPGGWLFMKCKSTDDPHYGQGEKLAENVYRSTHIRHFFSVHYAREKLASFKNVSVQATKGAYHNDHSAFIEAVAQRSMD
ncbi:MAG: class I SAM-dependent methyltransferase [Alphaproteobacteria bacterium]|nr:class I SAM-dependent methyltransferase [Alphaproteobacteria bacterium]